MKIAYFDCFAGAAGDMLTAAMIGAGVDAEKLTEQIQSLGIADLELKIEKTMRAGISCSYFKPVAPEEQPHRHLPDILGMIEASSISQRAKDDAKAIFDILARAEAKVHGKTPETIHFHEVGAVDSIVDIVSACVCMDMLGIDKVYCSSVATGWGMTKCAHGLIPVPAPATAEILKAAEIPTKPGPVEAELLTPTGAAILAHFAEGFGPAPQMTMESAGYGAGTADHKGFANAVRVTVGKTAETADAETDTVTLLETNIDDATGEEIGNLHDMLLEAGALDVFMTSIYMKKNRPATKFSVICRPAEQGRMTEMMLRSGITLGVRYQQMQREVLGRKIVEVGTRFGRIPVKIATYTGEIVSAKPEFDDCRAAAEKFGVTVAEVRSAALENLRQ